MKISIITPGGGRPQAFALCEKYMARQTVWKEHEIQWIVVDDNEKDPVRCTMGQEHIFGALPWRFGINTLRYNLDAGIKAATGDYLFVIENDDYYKPQYLEVYLSLLQHADLVGFGDVTYYSLRTRSFREMKNFQHASTCQTAWRKSYTPYILHAVHAGEPYPDLTIWGQARAAKRKYLLALGQDLCVGIKSTPGRGGIGIGHRADDFIPDNATHAKLKELLGPQDAEVYIKMMGEMRER
jgi:hypothetical protein